eukprot:Em0013g395a
MSIGDSNVVDGADVNPPSADAGPDPCVSNHDVLPLVPVVPDVPVSTEAMMPCTARRGIVEIPDHTGHHAAHSTPVTTPGTFTSTPVRTRSPRRYVHVHHAGHVLGVVNVYVAGVVNVYVTGVVNVYVPVCW